MSKYVFIYHGGGTPATPEEGKKAMDAWGAWFGSMGSAVVDGGNPMGKSSTVQVRRLAGLRRRRKSGQRLQPDRGVEHGGRAQEGQGLPDPAGRRHD